MHVITGPPTARGSLINNNDQNTINSDDKKHEEFFYRGGRSRVMFVMQKLCPCMGCCQKRNA